MDKTIKKHICMVVVDEVEGVLVVHLPTKHIYKQIHVYEYNAKETNIYGRVNR